MFSSLNRVTKRQTWFHKIDSDALRRRLKLEKIEYYISLRKLRWAGNLARMPMTRLPRQFLTSWVNHPRPHGRPQYTYGHSLTKSLKRTGIPPVFKEWSQLAQDRSNWRKLFYSKAEFPPTRQNWSFCSHFCMYFSHFRTSESIDVQSSAMQTHLHSKLLVIWIYLEGYLIILLFKKNLNPNRPGLAYSLEILKSTALNQFFEFDNEQDCIWKLETCSIELNKN